MSPEEKIQYVKNRIEEETAISPKGVIWYFLYSVGHPDYPEEYTILTRNEQSRIIKKLEEEKYIKNVQLSEDKKGFWLEKVQKKYQKKTTKSTKRSNLFSYIKTTDQLLQERELLNKILKIFGDIKPNQNNIRSTYEENDDIVQLLIDLEIAIYDWQDIEKQKHREIGTRIIEFEFESDKVIWLKSRITGKNGRVKKEALELIAKDIDERFTLEQISQIFTGVGVPESMFAEETKFQTLFYILSYYTTSKQHSDHIKFLKILEKVLHPLAFDGDELKAQEHQTKYNKYLKYDTIEIHNNKAYIGPTEGDLKNGMDYCISADGEVVEPKAYVTFPKQLAALWVLWSHLVLLVSAFQNNRALDHNELERLYLDMIGRIEDLIKSDEISNLKEVYVRPFTSLATADIEAKIKSCNTPLDLTYPFTLKITALNPDPVLVSEKREEYKDLIQRTESATKAITGDEKIDLSIISYEQALFILKIVAKYIFSILDAVSTGYITMTDEQLNKKYIHLSEHLKNLLARNDLAKIKENLPENLPEHLFEMLDEMDVWWSECGAQSQMMNFIGSIETAWVRTGEQTFLIPNWLVQFFDETQSVITEHRKNKNKKWEQILHNVDKQRKDAESTPETPPKKEEPKKIIHEHNHRFENSIQEKEITVQFQEKGEHKTAKEYKFPDKLPSGTKWNQLTIVFKDNENISIIFNKTEHNTNYRDMGFMDKKSKKPTRQWTLLKVLAQLNGEITIKDPDADKGFAKAKQKLTKQLQSYFSIDYDPFHPYYEASELNGKEKNSYKIKLLTYYEQQPEENEPADDISEFLKEQTPYL